MTPRTAACQAPLFSIISWSLLKFMFIESVMPSNHLCHLLLLLLQPFPASGSFPISWLKWPKYWNFSISPFNEYSGLISFRIDWFDLLAVQGTLKSLLQHREGINSSVLSLLCGSTFTSIYDYWKNHSFDLQTFVMKVMSLIFNMLSSFVLETFFQGVSIF